jgi:hypothetical protein
MIATQAAHLTKSESTMDALRKQGFPSALTGRHTPEYVEAR